LEDHDISVCILGMGRKMARLRGIPVLANTTLDLHGLERTFLPAPLFQ
jgi:hypothetical protein